MKNEFVLGRENNYFVACARTAFSLLLNVTNALTVYRLSFNVPCMHGLNHTNSYLRTLADEASG